MYVLIKIKDPEANTACVLTLLAVPGHLLFFFTITQIKLAQNQPINPATQTPLFVSFYISLLILQVSNTIPIY